MKNLLVIKEESNGQTLPQIPPTLDQIIQELFHLSSEKYVNLVGAYGPNMPPNLNEITIVIRLDAVHNDIRFVISLERRTLGKKSRVQWYTGFLTASGELIDWQTRMALRTCLVFTKPRIFDHFCQSNVSYFVYDR